MKDSNTELRRTAKAAGVPLWKIARELGISEPTMTRMMRTELDEDQRARFLAAVAKLEEQEDD